jgi:pyruvate dehydrogenase E2 component (dihydrolipoyllysine-residue acetyltransferase)
MASEVKLPRLGQGMESGVVVKWLKSEGAPVEKGEPLYELDTDKVTQEVESPLSGLLLKIVLPEGEAAVGATIAYIGEEGEQVPETAAESKPPKLEPEQTPQPQLEVVPAPVTLALAPSLDGTEPDLRKRASPLARRLARERGLDLEGMTGSGPEGRIVAVDVKRAAALDSAPGPPVSVGAVPGAVERIPLTNVRRTIARRLSEAWQAPAFQLTTAAEMNEVLAMRARLRERRQAGEQPPSIADFLTKACAQALIRYPGVNALWLANAIEIHHSVDIGIATATDRGLIVPVLRACEQKSLSELALARRDLVARTLEGTIALEELEGGTFTISNLGTFDVEQFIAVLNPPQVAIIAAGAVVERPVARGGEVEIAPTLTLTLTCDHRAVDGSVAAEFLVAVKGFLEEPGLML